MGQESKNANEGDKVSVVDSNNAHGLGSEQMSDMEARCADSTFPAAREVKPARGPMRETNADAVRLHNFGIRRIQLRLRV
jgi:hypothetical protein